MPSTRDDRLQTLWNESADSYHKHTSRFPTHRQITTLLISALTTGPTNVLDLGCGPGNSTRLLRRYLGGARLLGVDTAKAMVATAEQVTAPAENIEYRCADLAALTGMAQFDLVMLSNSFFHIEDKRRLISELDQVLAPGGHIVFSLYDSVFQPFRPLAWPLAETSPDTLMSLLVAELRSRGHRIAARQEDREILTESHLSNLFTSRGYTVVCVSALRLRRTPEERLSFFRIPVLAAEIFPDLDPAAVAAAIDRLDVPDHLPPQERLVYAFTAHRA